jgi:carboxymethylenebutenolidase
METLTHAARRSAAARWAVAHPPRPLAGREQDRGRNGQPWNRHGRLGAFGVCIGGHLSFRAAVKNADVRAAACFYATDLHTATLGKSGDDTLAGAGEIKAEMLMVWGRQDPHVPLEGRKKIYDALCESGVNFTWHEFNAQHAFLRDEGLRYDPALARIGYGLALELFHRKLR